MNRWKAAAVHLTISLTVATAISAVLYFLWFPPPYFIAAGASKLIMVLMGVDIGIGPLLTLLVVNPRKPKKLLRLDLSIIAVLQAMAFGYGIHAIAAARPVFVVAEIDRFVLVAADEIADADLAQGKLQVFRTRSWAGPVLVGATPPSGNEGIAIAEQALSGGKDIDRLPRFYVPYDQVVDKLMLRAKSLEQLGKATPDQRRRLDKLQAATKGGVLLVLPLQRGDHDFIAIISPRTKKPFQVLAIDPW